RVQVRRQLTAATQVQGGTQAFVNDACGPTQRAALGLHLPGAHGAPGLGQGFHQAFEQQLDQAVWCGGIHRGLVPHLAVGHRKRVRTAGAVGDLGAEHDVTGQQAT
ncbi:hypothetical protein RZS08_62355, partial [Arthrospira platensis SPKY1]|nr:hypothetical protein [Arthrospira platensis SPKY1]